MCFALALALGAPGPADAQGVRLAASLAGPALAAPDVAEPVRVRVAAHWGVDLAQVVVELGDAPTARFLASWSDVALVGTGAGGHWVARPADGQGPGIRIRAGVRTEVGVAARPLPRGHDVAPADVRQEMVVRWGPPPAAQPPAGRVGWRTLRMVAEGEALDPPAVQPPVAVEPGQVVELLWRRGGVAVRMEGTAAGRAAVGSEVVVRAGGGRRLRGVAVAPGVVDVTQGRGGS
jgi:flagella basal body P-ring formation protein FlgA